MEHRQDGYPTKHKSFSSTRVLGLHVQLNTSYQARQSFVWYFFSPPSPPNLGGYFISCFGARNVNCVSYQSNFLKSSRLNSQSLKIFSVKPGPSVSPACTGTTVLLPSECFMEMVTSFNADYPKFCFFQCANHFQPS